MTFYQLHHHTVYITHFSPASPRFKRAILNKKHAAIPITSQELHSPASPTPHIVFFTSIRYLELEERWLMLPPPSDSGRSPRSQGTIASFPAVSGDVHHYGISCVQQDLRIPLTAGGPRISLATRLIRPQSLI